MNELETIFDHGVTEEELGLLFGVPDFPEYLYKKFLNESAYKEENAYVDIYRLFLIREDTTNAKKYLDKIDNTAYKYFTLLNHDFAK